MNSILFFIVIITIPKYVICFAHMTKSVPNFMDLMEDEKLHIFRFQENVQEFSKYICNIYEMRQEKTFI